MHINLQRLRMRETLHRGCMWWSPELTSEQDMYDIAAGTQAVFEYCVKILSKYMGTGKYKSWQNT